MIVVETGLYLRVNRYQCEVVLIRDGYAYLACRSHSDFNEYVRHCGSLDVRYRWVEETRILEQALAGGMYSHIYKALGPRNQPTTQFGDDT